MENHPARLVAVTAAVLLAACGGNGDPTPVAPPEYAAEVAQRHLLTAGGRWAMSGTGPTGQAFTITMTRIPDSPFVFCSVPKLSDRHLDS